MVETAAGWGEVWGRQGRQGRQAQPWWGSALLAAAHPPLPARPVACSELLQQATRNARRVHVFRAKMQSVEGWMQKQALPHRLQHRIKTFYAEARGALGVLAGRCVAFAASCPDRGGGWKTLKPEAPLTPHTHRNAQVWIRQHEVKEESMLFLELPHALRNEVAWQACKPIFRRGLPGAARAAQGCLPAGPAERGAACGGAADAALAVNHVPAAPPRPPARRRVPLLCELDDKTLYLLASKMTPFRWVIP